VCPCLLHVPSDRLLIINIIPSQKNKKKVGDRATPMSIRFSLGSPILPDPKSSTVGETSQRQSFDLTKAMSSWMSPSMDLSLIISPTFCRTSPIMCTRRVRYPFRSSASLYDRNTRQTNILPPYADYTSGHQTSVYQSFTPTLVFSNLFTLTCPTWHYLNGPKHQRTLFGFTGRRWKVITSRLIFTNGLT